MQAQSNNSQLAVVKPSSNVVKVEKSAPIINNLDDIARVSKLLADSGFFSDAKSVAQCGVKVLAGYEMGFKAFQSMTGIHIIQGKPSVGAGLMAARIRSSGKYDYEVLEQSDILCKIAIFEIELKADIVGLKRQFAKGQIDQDRYKSAVEMLALGISSFNIEEARKAGTKNLDKFPKNMLFARAVSNAVKWYCPDVFDCSVYVPEELGAEVDGDGNVSYEAVEYRPQEIQQPKPQTQPQQPSEIDQLRQQLKATVEAKGWVLNEVSGWIKEQCKTRYGKDVTSQCTPDELKDLIQFVASYQPPQQSVEAEAEFDDTQL